MKNSWDFNQHVFEKKNAKKLLFLQEDFISCGLPLNVPFVKSVLGLEDGWKKQKRKLYLFF